MIGSDARMTGLTARRVVTGAQFQAALPVENQLLVRAVRIANREGAVAHPAGSIRMEADAFITESDPAHVSGRSRLLVQDDWLRADCGDQPEAAPVAIASLSVA